MHYPQYSQNQVAEPQYYYVPVNEVPAEKPRLVSAGVGIILVWLLLWSIQATVAIAFIEYAVALPEAWMEFFVFTLVASTWGVALTIAIYMVILAGKVKWAMPYGVRNLVSAPIWFTGLGIGLFIILGGLHLRAELIGL